MLQILHEMYLFFRFSFTVTASGIICDVGRDIGGNIVSSIDRDIEK